MRMRKNLVGLFNNACICLLLLLVGITIPPPAHAGGMAGVKAESGFAPRYGAVTAGYRFGLNTHGYPRGFHRYWQIDVQAMLGAHLGAEVAVRRFSDEQFHYKVVAGVEQPLIRYGEGTVSLPQWYFQGELIFLPEDYVDMMVGYLYRVNNVRQDPVWDRLSAGYTEYMPYIGMGGRLPQGFEVHLRVGVTVVHTSFLAQPYNYLWQNSQVTVRKVWK